VNTFSKFVKHTHWGDLEKTRTRVENVDKHSRVDVDVDSFSRDIDLLEGNIIVWTQLCSERKEFRQLSCRLSICMASITSDIPVRYRSEESESRFFLFISPGQTIPMDAIKKWSFDKDWYGKTIWKLNMNKLEDLSAQSAQSIIVLQILILTLLSTKRFRASSVEFLNGREKFNMPIRSPELPTLTRIPQNSKDWSS